MGVFHIKRYSETSFATSRYIFAIIGSHAVGKSELLKKIIGASIGTNYNYHRDTNVRIGYKPIQVTKSQILFLEVWDVPMEDINTIKLELPSLQGIILTFDPTNESSFQFIKSFYNQMLIITNFYCVATKDDILLLRSKRGDSTKNNQKIKRIKEFLKIHHIMSENQLSCGPINSTSLFSMFLYLIILDILKSRNF